MSRFDAVYIRKSTSPQEEQSQIDAIRDYLKRLGITVAEQWWFKDTGSRHRPEDRPDFQRMLTFIERGEIGRVFIWKQDRMVSGAKLWGHVMYLFEQAGTQLIDILTGKDLAADDIATEITTVVSARGARDEQVKISQNTLRAKVSLAREGMPISKLPPYGYDKKYIDAAGRHLWTAHVLTASREKGGTNYRIIMPDGGRYERTVPPRKAKTDRIVYVPTEEAPERIDVVRYAFRVFSAEAITVAGLAVRLNQLGHTMYGRPWLKMTLEDLLRNPAYVGSVRLGKVSRGEFTVFDGTQLVPADNSDRKITRNPVEQQIITPDRHQPLIDRKTWDAVQAKFAGRRTGPTPPRRDDLWLRGVLVCGGCGRPMHTSCQGKTTKGYICGSYYRFGQTQSEQFKTGCARNWVSHEQVERLVAQHLKAAGDDLAEPGETKGINAVMRDILGVRHQLTVAVRRAVTEYVRETCALFSQADGHQRFRHLLTEYTGRTVTDADLRNELDGLADESWDFTPEAARTLFVAFEEEKRALAGKRLGGLNREYEKWVLAKATAENDRERTLARTRCRELEEEITSWEARQTPLDDLLADLRSRLAEHRSRLEMAFRAIQGGSNRRKAEVVRELFSEIVLHFRQIKQTRRVQSVFLPDETEFRIAVMDVTSRRSCRRCRATGPTGTRPRPGCRSRTRPS